jgi:hypothetical protein
MKFSKAVPVFRTWKLLDVENRKTTTNAFVLVSLMSRTNWMNLVRR